jgi:hypothetical protein
VFACSVAAALLGARDAPAQPAQPPAQPPAQGDGPSIRLGTTIFADYTYTQAPEQLDADGNRIHPSAFNIGRAYINVRGSVSRLLSFRVTPDILRETGPGTAAGSYVFRLKYAYAEFDLGPWLPPGSRARLGMQPVPHLEHVQAVYRYRFQGRTFLDREGFLSTADAGAAFRYGLPGRRGDLYVAYFNGEGFSRFEVNDQKALHLGGTVRPLPGHPVSSGLRLAVLFDRDAYVRDAERRRLAAAVTFEHARLHAGIEALDAADRRSRTAARTDSRGYSLWATPRLAAGWEALLRYDWLRPDESAPASRSRGIAGLAYWFPVRGNVTSALLFDVEQVTPRGFVPSRPTERRFALHMLVNY